MIPKIRVEIKNGNAQIIINRPEKMNALNTRMLELLFTTLDEVDRDETVRVVVLRGQGQKAFIAGADIEELAGMDAYGYRAFGSLFTRISQRIMTLSKPVVAAVNGIAFGGGCLIAISCDLLVAVQEARFGFQEVNLGFMGATGILPKLVGRHRAAKITMLGEPFGVEEALGMGLVNQITSGKELDGAVTDLCQRLQKQSPEALHLIKQSIMVSLEAGISVASRYETEVSSICISGQPAQSRILGHLEK